MPVSELKLPDSTSENEARERLAADLESKADLISTATGIHPTFRDETVRDLRLQAAKLRRGGRK